jgi:ornithine carbamoyltransferase
MALGTAVDLRGRSFLTPRDFDADEIEALLGLSARLKTEKREGRELRRLAGKSIALIFEKDSTRTRIGFEVAACDQGAHVTSLRPTGSHVGKKESVKDTARVLGRVYDAIEFRGFHQTDVEALARFSGVPVDNGLTDEDHPTQVLADLLTIREHVHKPLHVVAARSGARRRPSIPRTTRRPSHGR